MTLSLPTGDTEERIQELLGCLQATWHSHLSTSTCRSRGPCDDHPERGNACHGAQGLTYVVTSGELAGVWHAWGDGAAGRIFEQMCTRVNELWQDRFDDVTRFSAALRGVSR